METSHGFEKSGLHDLSFFLIAFFDSLDTELTMESIPDNRRKLKVHRETMRVLSASETESVGGATGTRVTYTLLCPTLTCIMGCGDITKTTCGFTDNCGTGTSGVGCQPYPTGPVNTETCGCSPGPDPDPTPDPIFSDDGASCG